MVHYSISYPALCILSYRAPAWAGNCRRQIGSVLPSTLRVPYGHWASRTHASLARSICLSWRFTRDDGLSLCSSNPHRSIPRYSVDMFKHMVLEVHTCLLDIRKELTCFCSSHSHCVRAASERSLAFHAPDLWDPDFLMTIPETIPSL